MEAKTHFARFMRRGMELARQLHSKEIQRDEFDRAWKRLGDQIENAELFEKQNAAFVLNPREKDGKKLSGSLCSTLEKLQDVSLRRAMGNAAFELTGKQKAAQKIADILYTEVLQNDDV